MHLKRWENVSFVVGMVRNVCVEQCCCQDLFRSRDRDRDLDKMNSNALESWEHGLEITTLASSIPIGDRALA